MTQYVMCTQTGVIFAMKKNIDGLPVEDAKHPITITVKRCDMKADPKEPKTCVLAHAITRTLSPKSVRVHLSRVYINTSGKKWVRYLTPNDARQEIVSFDRGGAFEPGKFTFIPPHKSKRVTGKRQGGKKPGAAYKKTARRRYHLTVNVRDHA